jgi:hypothetical protein
MIYKYTYCVGEKNVEKQTKTQKKGGGACPHIPVTANVFILLRYLYTYVRKKI